MDFEPSEDQAALAGVIRAICQGRFPLERTRRAEEAEQVVDPDDWLALGEAGVFSLTLPESDGGVGLGLADAAVVFEELGRALVPGPLVASYLAAGLVDGAADGRTVVTLLEVPDPSSSFPPLIEHLASAGAVLCLPATTDPQGEVLQLGPDSWQGATTRVDEPLDPLTPMWSVSASFTRSLAAGSRSGPQHRVVGGAVVAREMRRHGSVLAAALQLGMAEACLALATTYAKDRRQFGRPIGSFQAVKHICADMLVRTEVARAAVHAAAVLSDQPEAAADEADTAGSSVIEVLVRAAAGAKVLADEAAIGNARSCIQVHGGVGFTWELPVHLYLKRARLLSTTFATAAEGCEVLAALT